MFTILSALVSVLSCRFRGRSSLELEVVALRHQLAVLRRQCPGRPRIGAWDRLLWALLYRLWPQCLEVMVLVKPATVIQWHRAGFRLYWRWRSRPRCLGRPRVDCQVRALIRQMSQANPLWGAPRIHGELLKLGIRIGQTAVAKYMARRPRLPSPSWRTFLKQHVEAIAATDMFIVVSATFQMLYVVIVLRHDRRKIAHFGVTRHPTQVWLAHQVTEAFPWDTTPRYLLRDRDTAYGHRFRERVRVMGLEQVVTAPRSPWQNAYVERVIGSIRRECLDYTIIFNERHLRRVLSSYVDYYHRSRTHLALAKDCPEGRPTQSPDAGKIIAIPQVGGLHHRYQRIAA